MCTTRFWNTYLHHIKMVCEIWRPVSNPYNIIQADDLSPVFLAHTRKKLISMFATVLIIYLIACPQWNFRTHTIIIGLLVIVGVDTGSHALIPLTFMRNVLLSMKWVLHYRIHVQPPNLLFCQLSCKTRV